MFSFPELLAQKKHSLVMGVLNVTPDSFSDGGEHFSPEKALERAREIEDEGADFLDIGACSTAPMNVPASEEEELLRLKEVLPLIASEVRLLISVDTFRPKIAAFALQNGASVINDESGVFCPETAGAVRRNGAGWIVMHTGGKTSADTGDGSDVVENVRSFFAKQRRMAEEAGILPQQLCYDYGIGFGKSRKDDLLLLKNTAAFFDFSPLLVGVSRKRVIGLASGEENPKNRVSGTVAADSIAVFSGASIVRVHDVKEAVDASRVADAIRMGEETWIES